MNIAEKLENRDLRPPKDGWMPGTYLRTCPGCGDEFVGHKGAMQCADCAYPNKKEIRPERAGELWVDESGYAYMTTQYGSTAPIQFLAGNGIYYFIQDRLKIRQMTRIHPPVEGEKIVIEGVDFADYEGEIVVCGNNLAEKMGDMLTKLPPMTMTLTWDKEKV